MKLLYTPNSPYARKVRVLIRERGATSLVAEEIVQPLEADEAFREINPLGKIPVLLVPDLGPLMDSPVVMTYLDAILPGLAEPSATAQGWSGQRRHALADGVLDAAVATMFENKRTDAAPSSFWLARWRRAMICGVAAIEAGADTIPMTPDSSAIAVGCMLGYLDFRFSDLDWRVSAPVLADWYAQAAARPAFLQTRPG